MLLHTQINLLKVFYLKTQVILYSNHFHLSLKIKQFMLHRAKVTVYSKINIIQGGSNMTGTDLCVNKPHCAAAVRP